MYPSIVPVLTRLNLDLDSSLIRLPLPALCIRFPKSKNPLTFIWENKETPIRCILLGEINEGRGLSILIDVGEVMGDGEDLAMPIYTYRNFRREDGLTVEQALLELGSNELAEVGVQIPEEMVTDCVRLCCSLCLLEYDPSVIEPDVLSKDAVADDFAKAERPFRRGAAEVFEKIHSDRSVERCLALLGVEEALEIRCRLAQAALMNFADEAIEPARRLVLDNDLDPDIIEVRNDLLAASMLMGVELPERERWQEDARHDVESRRQWYAERLLVDGGDEDDAYPDADYEIDHEEPTRPSETVVREGPKIGRNDPCPCGSGKKYKKCCLRKQNGAGLFE